MDKIKYPYNIETEKALLNVVMTDIDASIEILSDVEVEDFYAESHKIIYGAAKILEDNASGTDSISIMDYLNRNGFSAKMGGMTYLNEILAELPSTADYKNYITKLKRDSVSRRLMNASRKIETEVVKYDTAEEALNFAEKKIYDISESKDKSHLMPASEYADEVMDFIKTAVTDKNSTRGLTTDFPKFDKLFNGLHKGELIILAARPSVGKTAFAMNLIANMLAKSSEEVLAVFSLEMPAMQLLLRLYANLSDTSMKKAVEGTLGADLAKLHKSRDTVKKGNLYIDDTSMITPSQILSKCRRLKKTKGRLDFVVVDYLQLMDIPDKQDRQNDVATMSRHMKVAAKELSCPILVLSQLSRGIETRKEKTPLLSDLRDSGAIEQDADIVMFLSNDTEEGITRMLHIAKHRNGETGQIRYSFKGESMKFQEFSEATSNERMPIPQQQPVANSAVSSTKQEELKPIVDNHAKAEENDDKNLPF